VVGGLGPAAQRHLDRGLPEVGDLDLGRRRGEHARVVEQAVPLQSGVTPPLSEGALGALREHRDAILQELAGEEDAQD
jgi:hypothetical protein